MVPLREGPADDGKRFSSDGRSVCRWVDEIEEWGGGLGEGGRQILPDRTRADFFRPQKQSSHAGKSHFFRNSQVFRFFVFFKNDVLPAWELYFRVF